MNDKLNTTTMTTQIRTAIESYISKEARLNREVERYQIAVDCETEEIEILSERVDIMESQLIREVKINAIAFNIKETSFIDLVVEFETRRAA